MTNTPFGIGPAPLAVLRRTLWFLAALIMLVPSAALAGSPGWLRLAGGAGFGSAGFGSAHSGDLEDSPIHVSAALDIGWASVPGRAYVLSLEAGGMGAGGYSTAYLSRSSSSISTYQSILLGVDRSWVSRAGAFAHGGLGVGRIHSDHGSHRSSTIGLAASAGIGLRLIPNPSPIGLIVALRSSNVIASGAKSYGVAVLLGLTVFPH